MSRIPFETRGKIEKYSFQQMEVGIQVGFSHHYGFHSHELEETITRVWFLGDLARKLADQPEPRVSRFVGEGETGKVSPGTMKI